MAVGIIDIDLRDAAFQKFLKLYDKHQEALKKLPKDWDEVGKAAGRTGKEQLRLNAMLEAQKQLLKDGAIAAGGFERALAGGGRALHTMAQNAGNIASHLRDTTRTLAKWSAIGGGLVGIGGLFGIDRLASAAGGLRRSAQGLGVSSGEQQSFEANYNKFFDARSVLGNIADAQHDPSKRWAFSSMGVSGIDQKDPVELGTEMAIRAKKIFEQGGGSQANAEARGLLQFYTMDDLRRLHAMSEQEINDAALKTKQDQRNFAISDDMLKVWQNLTIQLSKAYTAIENSLIRGLAPLAGPLEKLSGAVGHAIDDFLKSKQLGEWIEMFAGWVEKAGSYLASEQFSKDVQSFVDKVMRLGAMIGEFADWLLTKIPNAAPQISGGPAPTTSTERAIMGARESIFGVRVPEADGDLASKQARLAALERKFGFPTGVLDQVWAHETSRGTDNVDSWGYDKNGKPKLLASGQFQLAPETASSLDLSYKDTFDFNKSSQGAGELFKDLMNQYHNDTAKALAAWNWRPSALDADVKQHPNDWLNYAPKETQKFVGDITTQLHIKVYPTPGSDVNVTANTANTP